jgi:hypothetical protein
VTIQDNIQQTQNGMKNTGTNNNKLTLKVNATIMGQNSAKIS